MERREEERAETDKNEDVISRELYRRRQGIYFNIH